MPFYFTLLLNNCANICRSWRWEGCVRVVTALITQTGTFPERFLPLRSYLRCVREPLRAPCFHSPAAGSLHVGRTAHKYAARRAQLRGRGGKGGFFFYTPVQVCLTSMATNLCNPRAPCEAVIKLESGTEETLISC